MHDHLFDFLKANKKLTCNQSAFQKLCSTTTSLISSTDYWYENMNSRKINLTLYLDLKKAFDRVDHSALLKKLRAYGIRGPAGDWFESYLKEIKQYCAANEHRSNIKNTCGILQGSCLGPLLFIIYVNDFEKCLEFSQASLYADDTQITIASDDIRKLVLDMQQELVNLSEWMRINKLSPTPPKTEYMTIGHPRRIKQLEILDALLLNGTAIERVPKSKSHGVIIDESLTWDKQFKAVKSKVCGGLSALKKIKNIIPQSQLCSVFHAIVESHLRYADLIWESLSKTELDTLQRLHNRAHTLIENALIRDEWSSNWLSVENLIRFDRSLMAYNILSKLSPESLWDKYQYRSAYSNYVTRNCKDLQRLKIEHANKGFYYSALKAWNDILANIREIQTLRRFTRELQAHLTS